MADPGNSRWRLEIPEECPVCAFTKNTRANQRGITRTKAKRLFPLQWKDSVHNGLAEVAPEGQWAHRVSVQTLEAWYRGYCIQARLGTLFSFVFALKIAPHKSLHRILFRATCTFLFPGRGTWEQSNKSSPLLPLGLFPCCTFIHLPNSASKLLAGMVFPQTSPRLLSYTFDHLQNRWWWWWLLQQPGLQN